MTELMGSTLNINSSSESTELMPVTGVPVQNNPFDLLPPEILNGVFHLLDQNSLQRTRLVCRKWNDFALPILSKTPGRVELCFRNHNAMSVEVLTERIQKLQSILSFTEYPGMFFSELMCNIFFGVLEQEFQLLNLLQQFGSSLKSLELKCMSLTLPTLRKMLEMWCENLEELTLFVIIVTEDNTTIERFKTSPSPLKLKLRKFRARAEIELPIVTNLFVSIIKMSPKLQVLHVEIFLGQLDFWRKMQNLPEITKNLEEVRIESYRDGIANVSAVSFSNKLTFLTLSIYNDSFLKKQLVRLLYKVGESLEKLVLQLYVRLDWKIKPNLQFPLMKKLKVMEYSFRSNPVFDTIDICKKMPNLKILRFAGYFKNADQSDLVDVMFSNAWHLSMLPHNTLNTMSIIGSPNKPETVFSINRAFPNLRDLTLPVDCSEIPESTKEGWLTRICTGFSEMKNMKILHLYSHDSLKWDQKFNFEECFGPLQASKSLEDLTITRHRKIVYCRDPEKFPAGLEKVLVKIPKLKLVTLNRFYMEKSESMELFKTLDEKGILLKEGEG